MGDKPLRWFTIEGRFEAEDIDDALAFLAEHFTAEANGSSLALGRLLEIEVKPE